MALVAYCLGEVFTQYCVVVRGPDFDDPEVFPFGGVSGVGVTYRMVEGLTITIKPRYSEGPTADARWLRH